MRTSGLDLHYWQGTAVRRQPTNESKHVVACCILDIFESGFDGIWKRLDLAVVCFSVREGKESAVNSPRKIILLFNNLWIILVPKIRLPRSFVFVEGLLVTSIDVVWNGCELYFTCIVDEILHDCLVEQEPEYRGRGFKTREEMGVLGNGVLLTVIVMTFWYVLSERT